MAVKPNMMAGLVPPSSNQLLLRCAALAGQGPLAASSFGLPPPKLLSAGPPNLRKQMRCGNPPMRHDSPKFGNRGSLLTAFDPRLRLHLRADSGTVAGTDVLCSFFSFRVA